MKIFLSFFFTAWAILFTSGDISMLGVKINDPESVLKKIKLQIVANDEGMTKYRTENGNDFSATVKNGKIAYLENDWLQNGNATTPLFTKFKFGKTTLREIRNSFENNGFTYRERNSITTETDEIEFNCFEFNSLNNEVLVTITKVSLKANLTSKCR